MTEINTTVESHAIQFANLINKKSYKKVNQLSSGIAKVLLHDEQQLKLWLEKVDNHLNLVKGIKFTFRESHNHIVRKLLKVGNNTRFFSTVGGEGLVKAGDNLEEAEKRVWENARHFTLTTQGWRYLGQVTYEQLHAAYKDS